MAKMQPTSQDQVLMEMERNLEKEYLPILLETSPMNLLAQMYQDQEHMTQILIQQRHLLLLINKEEANVTSLM